MSFFRQIYRLHNWPYKEGQHKRPKYLGKLVNQLVYAKLPPGVLPELRKLNPPGESGYRRYKHHQFLTSDTGHPHLDKQIIETTTLMRVSDDKKSFGRLFDKAFPAKYQQIELALGQQEG